MTSKLDEDYEGYIGMRYYKLDYFSNLRFCIRKMKIQ